jgi:ribosomal protein L40E
LRKSLVAVAASTSAARCLMVAALTSRSACASLRFASDTFSSCRRCSTIAPPRATSCSASGTSISMSTSPAFTFSPMSRFTWRTMPDARARRSAR